MSSMIEFRIGYFLIGAVVFVGMRVFEKLKFFGGNELPNKDTLMIVYLMIASAFTWVLASQIIYLIDIATISSGLILNEIMGIILLSISAFLFYSNSFIYPSKNFLISVIIGGVVATVLTFIFISTGSEILIEGYSKLIWGFIAHLIGLVVGLIIYIILYYTYKQGLNNLWEAKSFWKIINNYWLLIPLWVLLIIESILSLRNLSLLTLFM
ncbi:MAG: hypothetical protein ACTSRP_07895 [Candidatus Helarchaeota archaeon]